MARKSRLVSAREAKDRRMKMIAVGGAVLLAVVLAFEIPHMLKKNGGGSSSAPAATTATTPGTDPTATAAPAATPTATPAALAPTGSTKLPDSDAAPRRSKSELYSFSHFAGKDPFKQQISSGTSLPTPPASTAAPAPSPTAPTTAKVQNPSPQLTSARSLARSGSVTISVNGRLASVRIGGSFPSSNPLFKLVSVSRGVVRIGIASGSYASGAQTVSLVAGRTLTLVDTADGIRYRLRLVTAS
jgi:hypothetical protein